MTPISIRDIQGESLNSSYAGQRVVARGIVTGVMRRGFFFQTQSKQWDGKGSDALFVYSPDWSPELGNDVEVTGDVVDFTKHETAKPVTQLHFESVKLHNTEGESIVPLLVNKEFFPDDNDALAKQLNSLEGMLLAVDAGATFIAPSNKYGDYVLAMDHEGLDESVLRNEHKGALVESENPLRWFPGFRITNYNHAERLNVGSTLKSRVQGPLNYRVDSYQISVSSPFEVENHFVSLAKSTLLPEDDYLTIMTLNCFNLDPHVEAQSKVMNPRQDVDDDWGEGRFHTLAQAVVLQANVPDIVALQEIQDNDGAEISSEVEASETYRLLILVIKKLCGIEYKWVDIPPEQGADGGQPGGNIRNGYLFNPDRVSLDEKSVRVFGADDESFDNSRKPLVCTFTEKKSGKSIAVINIHLASKRHQESIFAPINPGVDAKLSVRVAQASCIRIESEKILESGTPYYITGDFNDTETSDTLTELIGSHGKNMLMSLAPCERYDYNHRGKLQVLMHGIANKELAKKSEYEIIHGNELIGIMPGEQSDKPSDHAYVIAKLSLK